MYFPRFLDVFYIINQLIVGPKCPVFLGGGSQGRRQLEKNYLFCVTEQFGALNALSGEVPKSLRPASFSARYIAARKTSRAYRSRFHRYVFCFPRNNNTVIFLARSSISQIESKLARKMVYLHFPSTLTEEELMLQAKYNKLKRKKKALQDLKTPKPEPERMPQAPKRPTEARDAREVAKKLIKSGVITAPKTPKRAEQSFKRPRGLERKLNSTEKTVCSYQPFCPTQPEEEETETAKPRVKDLYDSFVSAQDKTEERAGTTVDKPAPMKPEPKPRGGNTIFVFGYKISDDFLKKHFQSFGNIVHISMETEKNRGFITFDKSEAAERAISEMDGSMVSSIQLKVSLARRQPVIDPINDTTSSALWSSIAANYSQKSGHKDRRDVTVYEEDLFQ